MRQVWIEVWKAGLLKGKVWMRIVPSAMRTLNGNVSDCLRLRTNSNDHFSQPKTEALFSGAHTHTHMPKSNLAPHQTLSTTAPTLPNLYPDIKLVCYAFNFHISSAFPFSCSPSPPTAQYGNSQVCALWAIPPSSSSYPNITFVFVFNIRMSGEKRW